MKSRPHFFLGFAERAECNCLRKSRLMLASNFLVGTRFSSFRFSFGSIVLQLKTNFQCWLLNLAAKISQVLQQLMQQDVTGSTLRLEPSLSAIAAYRLNHVISINWDINPRFTARTFELKSNNILNLDQRSLFCGHFASSVRP